MKLFVTDIDDTLSSSAGGEPGAVSEEVRSACGRLRENGWEIMVATGRIFGAAKKHIHAIGATSQPAILYDGARVMTAQGKEVWSTPMLPALAELVLAEIWEWPVEIQIAGDEVVHCRESDSETAFFYRNAGVPVHYVTEPHAPGPVYRIGIWAPSVDFSALERRAKELFAGVLEVTSGGPCFLDILAKGVTKGTVLTTLLAALPEWPEIVVAAGDDENDFEMLLCADIAAVPENASKILLPQADVIMPSASAHGILFLADWLLSPAFSPKSRKGRPLTLGE